MGTERAGLRSAGDAMRWAWGRCGQRWGQVPAQKAEGGPIKPPTQSRWPVGLSGPPGPPRPGLEESHQVDGTGCQPGSGCLRHRMVASGDRDTLVSLSSKRTGPGIPGSV